MALQDHGYTKGHREHIPFDIDVLLSELTLSRSEDGPFSLVLNAHLSTFCNDTILKSLEMLDNSPVPDFIFTKCHSPDMPHADHLKTVALIRNPYNACLSNFWATHANELLDASKPASTQSARDRLPTLKYFGDYFANYLIHFYHPFLVAIANKGDNLTVISYEGLLSDPAKSAKTILDALFPGNKFDDKIIENVCSQQMGEENHGVGTSVMTEGRRGVIPSDRSIVMAENYASALEGPAAELILKVLTITETERSNEQLGLILEGYRELLLGA